MRNSKVDDLLMPEAEIPSQKLRVEVTRWMATWAFVPASVARMRFWIFES